MMRQSVSVTDQKKTNEKNCKPKTKLIYNKLQIDSHVGDDDGQCDKV